jgi:TolC family type I secretion outer membrane protein
MMLMATVLPLGLGACGQSGDTTGSLCVAAGESAIARCADATASEATIPAGTLSEDAAPPGPQSLGRINPSPPILLPPVDNVSRADKPEVAPTTLSAAIARALEQNPEIGMALANAREARAGIGVARAGLYPQVEGRVAGGIGAGGNYTTPWGTEFFDAKQTTGSARAELGLSAQQLLYDFGATANDVNRSKNNYQSQVESALDTGEDIAQRVAEAYLRILEQSELFSVANQNMTELQRIAKLVQDNESNGNATVADTKRVKARLSEADQNRIDIQLSLQIANDQFKLLVGTAAGKLRPAPSLRSALPASPVAAIELAERRSPRLKASESAIRAAKNEIDGIRGLGAARIELQGDYLSKNFSGIDTSSELDARAMLALRYKFIDGGLNSSKLEEASARLHKEEMRYRYERDDLSSRLRQAYQSLSSARGKTQQIQDGLQASSKARELYLEQFSGGKRSLLELLDVQASWYIARRNEISNRYDEHKSSYSVLRSVGQLAQVVLATPMTAAPEKGQKTASKAKERR